MALLINTITATVTFTFRHFPASFVQRHLQVRLRNNQRTLELGVVTKMNLSAAKTSLEDLLWRAAIAI